MTGLHCLCHRYSRTLNRLELILVSERLVVRSQEIGRQDISVGLVSDGKLESPRMIIKHCYL